MTDGYFDGCREFATLPHKDDPSYTVIGLGVVVSPVGIPLYYLGRLAARHIEDGDAE